MSGSTSGKGRRRLLAGAIGAAMGAVVLIFPPISASATTNIAIRDFPNCGGATFCYTPANASSTVGENVVWTNFGTDHTVTRCTTAVCGTNGGTGTDNTFTTSGNIPSGGTYSHAFTAPGTYVYYCQYHGFAGMNGKVTVAGSGGTTTTIPPTTTTTTTVPGGTPPSLSVGDVAVSEGDAKTRTAYFPVTMSKASAQTVTVNYATATGTAVGSDFTAKSGTLTLVAGKVKATIAVPVKGDTVDEANETFSVNLSAPTNATIGDGTGTGTIRDDDPGSGVRATIGDVTTYEGNAGTQTATFTVSLSAPSVNTVTLAYATADGTAVAPSDYTTKTGTVSFAPGAVSKSVAVTVKSNTVAEPNETFTVVLSSPTGGATITDATGVGTVRNDD